MTVYTLDTNAIIYFAQGDSLAVSLLEPIFQSDAPLFVSAMTELELFSFALVPLNEEVGIERILQTVAVIPLDSRIARTAGWLRQRYRLKAPDSAIVATALSTGSTLITRNVRDFRRVADLQVLPI